jgi:hypothetical protein
MPPWSFSTGREVASEHVGVCVCVGNKRKEKKEKKRKEKKKWLNAGHWKVNGL